MIKINHYAANATSVTCGETTVFFSYQTVVAIHHYKFQVKTKRRYSNTTSRHMTKMGVNNYAPLPDAEFDRLVESLTITSPQLSSILPESFNG